MIALALMARSAMVSTWMLRVVAIMCALATTARGDVELSSLGAGAASCDRARAHCFGVHLHVAIGDHGPVATADWVAGQLAAANQHFAPIGVGWQIVAIDALPASAVRVENRRERDTFAASVKGTVIHVFVTGKLDDIDDPDGTVYGVTWLAHDRKYIILSTEAWQRTLAHELGHVFSLPHSTYPISIMNKSPRDQPPPEQRTFADEEIKVMKSALARLVRGKVFVDLP